MTTPTEWLAKFQVNTGTANTPNVESPQIIGLSNGNFLVAWEEPGTNGVGTAADIDIIGKIFDAEGNVVIDSFVINQTFTSDDENDFSIAATNDGGFIMVYVDDASPTSNFADINWERYDSTGALTDFLEIATANDPDGQLSNPQVVVNQADNSSFVTWTDPTNGTDDNIFGVRLDAAGTAGATFTVSGNAQDDNQNATAMNTLGNPVTAIFREGSILLREHDASGTLVHAGILATGVTGGEPQLAGLLNGNIAVTWEDGGDIRYTIAQPDPGGIGYFVPVNNQLVTGGTNLQNDVQIVAMPDGGFTIVWDDDTAGEFNGQRYNADGMVNGSAFSIETIGNPFGEVGVTADGRLLFTWQLSGDIFTSIYDPRDGATIEASDYNGTPGNFLGGSNIITANTNGSTINGTSAAETILGQGGDDTINGAGGDDTLTGGDSLDFLEGGAGLDTINGGAGDDTLYIVAGSDIVAGETYDGGADSDSLWFNVSADGSTGAGGTFDLSTVNLANLERVDFDGFSGQTVTVVVSGDQIGGGALSSSLELNGWATADIFRVNLGTSSNIDLSGFTFGNWTDGTDRVEINGGTGSNTIIGTDVRDTIYGGGGNDIIFGGAENDVLDGGLGIDRLDGGTGADDMTGGLDNDVYYVDNVGDNILGEIGFSSGGGIDTVYSSISYTLGANLEVLRLEGSANLNGTGSNAPVALVGNTGNNVLSGNGGNDAITAKAGNDTLDGGVGRDTLVGDEGNDTFLYGAIADSYDGAADRDFINGFVHGEDKIDLSLIDANPFSAGDQAFTFIGNAAFSGGGASGAGQLRWFTFSGGNFNIVEADWNGDGMEDMQIFVNQTDFMLASDFDL